MKKTELRNLIREVVKSTSVLTEGMFSGIDLIAKQSKSKEQFVAKLKAFVKKSAADPSLADDKEFLQQMADLYFTESGEKVTESILKLKRYIVESTIKLSEAPLESPTTVSDVTLDTDNTYMFFQNVKSIHKMTSEILNMNHSQVSNLLSEGHGWALDHIATAADDVTEVHGFISGNLSESITEAIGAFRRLVIDTGKLDLVSKEISDFIKKPNIKSDYPDAKITVKPGVKPNVLVVDVEATSGTALANKISDVAKKFDKGAKIKVRKELKLKPSK